MDETPPTSRMLSWARNSTIYRLERRMMTEKQLFDAIAKKAKQKFEDIGAEQIKALADFAVKFAYELKVLDDVAYAEISTRSAVRSGKSKKAIAFKLASKGIHSETVVAAVEEVDDLHAAVIFARKRGFGPFRRGDLDEKRKSKELSAFARNGFSFAVGKKVFDMERHDAEEVLQSTSAF
ncbi:recombination regulator RecX [Rhizobium lusitanum]|uniref:recombination regulator RecX n=1 Tax=Rhizobium lusitanum TaxID=293958 RepID=UPI0019577994|nr:recombination regulator RecX [Rhizobium lusitanum]MBM7047052.1 recombination regulator RecX [Rhizobium lusitanum]